MKTAKKLIQDYGTKKQEVFWTDGTSTIYKAGEMPEDVKSHIMEVHAKGKLIWEKKTWRDAVDEETASIIDDINIIKDYQQPPTPEEGYGGMHG